MIYNQMVELLEKNCGNWISGEFIAQKMNITRAAVWKNIKKLQDEGYEIESITGKGYRLSDTSDILSSASIQRYLKDDNYILDIRKSVTSTNDIIKEKALNKLSEKNIVIAEYQSAGKGRRGRSFFTSEHAGIYMSILLRPTFDIQNSLLITAAAAVAVHDAIKEVCKINTDIKWVNDIQIEGKKICGILCEAAYEIDSASFDYVILGIGINTKNVPFPVELEDIVTSLDQHSDQPFLRSQLIASIIQHFFNHYDHMDQKDFLDTYRSASSIIGKEITVFQGNQEYNAYAQSIDDQGNLTIIKDGSVMTLLSGEVSIRSL